MANAQVKVLDCNGKQLAKAATNAQGVANFTRLSPDPGSCGDSINAYFVSARSLDDLAFIWSYWHKVIEPWRFDVPTSTDTRTDERAHTIFDRTLLHAGKTVSMKHILRTKNSRGFDLAVVQPASLSVTHIGSGQQYTQPIVWRKTATGGQSAENTFATPPAANLGMFSVELRAQDPGKKPQQNQFDIYSGAAIARVYDVKDQKESKNSTFDVENDLEINAKITSPISGSIIALDPDIPPNRQRISFRAEERDLRWQIDGKAFARGAEVQ